jgi:hypothetical protein
MATNRLRNFFDPGGGICLWSANDAARERFGYPVEARSLPLTENTWRRVAYLCAWYDTSIDWRYPPHASPWEESVEPGCYNQAGTTALVTVVYFPQVQFDERTSHAQHPPGSGIVPPGSGFEFAGG